MKVFSLVIETWISWSYTSAVQYSPEGWDFVQQYLEHRHVPLEGRVVRLDLLPDRRHAHLEQSLDFRVTPDPVSLCEKDSN